jgi:hypothetical protein
MPFWRSNYFYLVVVYIVALMVLIVDKAHSESRCGAFTVSNLTSTWVKRDQLALDRAKIGCGEKFKVERCLKKFIKKGEGRYYAICSTGQDTLNRGPVRRGTSWYPGAPPQMEDQSIKYTKD